MGRCLGGPQLLRNSVQNEGPPTHQHPRVHLQTEMALVRPGLWAVVMATEWPSNEIKEIGQLPLTACVGPSCRGDRGVGCSLQAVPSPGRPVGPPTVPAHCIPLAWPLQQPNQPLPQDLCIATTSLCILPQQPILPPLLRAWYLPVSAYHPHPVTPRGLGKLVEWQRHSKHGWAQQQLTDSTQGLGTVSPAGHSPPTLSGGETAVPE